MDNQIFGNKVFVPCKCGQIYFTAYESTNPETGKRSELFEIGFNAIVESKDSINRALSSVITFTLKPNTSLAFFENNEKEIYKLVREELSPKETKVDNLVKTYEFFYIAMKEAIKQAGILAK